MTKKEKRDLKVSQAQILIAKAAKFGAKVITLRETFISPVTIGLIRPSWAWHYRIVPVEKTKDHIVIAMEDPADLDTIDSLMYWLNTEIEIRVAAKDDVEEALKKYYSDGEEDGKRSREESRSISAE